MALYILTVIFWIRGEPTILDGWHPISVQGAAKCSEMKANIERELLPASPYKFQVECIEEVQDHG